MRDEQLTLSSVTLKTPRAAAIAGIIFAVLFSSSVVLLRLSISVNPTDGGVWLRDRAEAVSLALLISITSSLWVTLIFPGRVCVASLHILVLNLRSPSVSQRSTL